MKVKYGMPQYLFFDMSILPHNGDFRKWENGKIHPNSWFDIADLKGGESFGDLKGLRDGILRYCDLPYICYPEKAPFTSIPIHYEKCDILIPWPVYRDTVNCYPVAVRSETEEFACLLDFLIFCYTSWDKSFKISSDIDGSMRRGELTKEKAEEMKENLFYPRFETKEILDLHLEWSQNKTELIEFIKRCLPSTKSEVLHVLNNNDRPLPMYGHFFWNPEEVPESHWLNPILEIKTWLSSAEGIVKKQSQELSTTLQAPTDIVKKLNWTSEKKTLIDVFVQLEEHSPSLGSSAEIAKILKRSFSCFVDWNEETIATEYRRIKNGDRPKRSRIDLNLGE